MIISVPTSIVRSLLIKQFRRYFANLKGNPKIYLKTGDTRRFYVNWESVPSTHSLKHDYTGHKGFGYRKIEKLL